MRMRHRSALPAAGLFVAVQILGGCWQPLFLTPVSLAEYCAIHACHGQNASLNSLARAELEEVGRNIRSAKGRFYFDAEGDQVQALSAVRHVRSIRRIVLCVEAADPLPEGETSAEQVAQCMDGLADWDSAVRDLSALQIRVQSCCVVSRQFKKLDGLVGSDLAHNLHRELGLCFQRRFGWSPQGRGRSSDLTLHLHVEGQLLLLEVPLLQQQKARLGGYFPHQGMHHVEAWAIARSLELKTGETVLDPMCGKGTILAEAAVWWPSAAFVGCDVDPGQLEQCRRNFEWLKQDVQVHRANTTSLGGTPLADSSVDKVAVAPPWNRQFSIRCDLVDFYSRMLQEIFRVVRPEGRVVLFASRKILPKLKAALKMVQGQGLQHGTWQLTAERRFALTRATTGVILVLESRRQGFSLAAMPASFLSWEGQAPQSGRELYEHWRSLRAQGFPRLEAVAAGSQAPRRQVSRGGRRQLLLLLCFLGAGLILTVRLKM